MNDSVADLGPSLHELGLYLKIRVQLLLQAHKVLIGACDAHVDDTELPNILDHGSEPPKLVLVDQIYEAGLLILIEKGLIRIGDKHSHSAIAGRDFYVEIASLLSLQLVLVNVDLVYFVGVIEIRHMSPHCGTNLEVPNLTAGDRDLKFYLVIFYACGVCRIRVASLHCDLDQDHVLVLLHTYRQEIVALAGGSSDFCR